MTLNSCFKVLLPLAQIRSFVTCRDQISLGWNAKPGQASLSPVSHHSSSPDCSKRNWSIACDLTMTQQMVNFERQSLRLFAGWMNKNPINRGNFHTKLKNAEDPRNMTESDWQNEHWSTLQTTTTGSTLTHNDQGAEGLGVHTLGSLPGLAWPAISAMSPDVLSKWVAPATAHGQHSSPQLESFKFNTRDTQWIFAAGNWNVFMVSNKSPLCDYEKRNPFLTVMDLPYLEVGT